MKKEPWKTKDLIFRCDCGHPGYLEFSFDPDDGGSIWVLQTDEPKSFLHWLKQWFYRKVYHSEVLLSPSDVDRLIKFLSKTKEEPNGQE